MENKLLKAALLHFEANKLKTEANLEIYLKNPVAIGEHPDLATEIINLIRSIAEADECIKIIKERK
tara:strand:+ start:849 stop:1046 length:198 start_codon:yes stop_codon:yes gene_type:complete